MTRPRRGRPRDETAHRAILVATAGLLGDVGFDAMTIESIASRAGVGRQTIYRRWSSRAEIVAAAVLAGHVRPLPAAVPDTGVLRDDLLRWADNAARSVHDPHGAQLTRSLVAAAASNPADSAALYAQLTGPFHRALVERLTAGQSEGQLAPTVDPTAAADALIGTHLFTVLAHQHSIERLVKVVDALTPPAAP